MSGTMVVGTLQPVKMVKQMHFLVALSCVNDIMLRELRNKLEMQLIL